MKSLAFLVLPFAVLCCAPPTPPVQKLDALPAVPSGTADAAQADIGASLDPGAPPAPSEPFPPVSGMLDAKPWELKGAATLGQVQKDGTVLIALANYLMDCDSHEASPEDRTITLMIPWQARAKVDLAKLRATETWAMGFDEKKKKPAKIKAWKPTGSVNVVAAPVRQKLGAHQDRLVNGKDAISAEIPVRFCFTE